LGNPKRPYSIRKSPGFNRYIGKICRESLAVSFRPLTFTQNDQADATKRTVFFVRVSDVHVLYR
jgi:hypothetical protein